MNGVHKVVLYLHVGTWFSTLHQPCQPLQPVVDGLVEVMCLAENRSYGDRIPPPVHAIVVIFIHDALQWQQGTDCSSFIFIAYLLIPLYLTIRRYIMLQHGNADITEAIDLLKD